VGNISGLLEVKSVKAEFGGQANDGLYKGSAVLRSNCRREIAGASPSTDGHTGHGTGFLSLVNELGKVREISVGKVEDGGIGGGEAKRALSTTC
jgi:hypothetical protein